MSAQQEVLGDNRRLGIRDVRLAERALREQWPIPDALRGRLIARLGEVLDDPAATPREVIAAARALLSASQHNLATIRMMHEIVHAEDRPVPSADKKATPSRNSSPCAAARCAERSTNGDTA